MLAWELLLLTVTAVLQHSQLTLPVTVGQSLYLKRWCFAIYRLYFSATGAQAFDPQKMTATRRGCRWSCSWLIALKPGLLTASRCQHHPGGKTGSFCGPLFDKPVRCYRPAAGCG
jgi:hypothetical protein